MLGVTLKDRKRAADIKYNKGRRRIKENKTVKMAMDRTYDKEKQDEMDLNYNKMAAT